MPVPEWWIWEFYMAVVEWEQEILNTINGRKVTRTEGTGVFIIRIRLYYIQIQCS